MTKYRISFLFFMIAVFAGIYFAKAGRETKYLKPGLIDAYQQMQTVAHDLKTDCNTCHTLGRLWLTKTGEKAREMMKYSVDLNLNCIDCHETLEKFTERGDFTKKWMFPMVKNFKVECLTCHHSSENRFTIKGRKARVMLDYSIKKDFECQKCHLKNSSLNENDLTEVASDEQSEDDFPLLTNAGIENFEKVHNIDSMIVIKRY